MEEQEYISLYDFIEWAKENYTDYTTTANDLIRLLNGKSLQLYRRYSGIKPSIEKERINLKQALEFVAKHNGYEGNMIFFVVNIPF